MNHHTASGGEIEGKAKHSPHQLVAWPSALTRRHRPRSPLSRMSLPAGAAFDIEVIEERVGWDLADAADRADFATGRAGFLPCSEGFS